MRRGDVPPGGAGPDSLCAAPFAPKALMTLILPRFRFALSRGAAVALAFAALMSACAQPGAPRMSVTGGGADQDGPLVVTAGGRDVIVAPPAGFCVDREAVQDQGAAVFVLIEDCTLLGAVPATGEAALVNGLVTLSIGAEPLFDAQGADRRVAAARLERFLRSDEGRVTVGMGGGANDISIVESRSFDGVLFILIEDRSPDAAPILSPRLWRAFTELNGRAAIAALSVFETSAIGDAAMLAHLARVVAALKLANGDKVGPEEAQLALAAPRPTRRPARNVRVSANGISVPMPSQRPRAVGTAAIRAAVPDIETPTEATASDQAPKAAPRAMPRAKRS